MYQPYECVLLNNIQTIQSIFFLIITTIDEIFTIFYTTNWYKLGSGQNSVIKNNDCNRKPLQNTATRTPSLPSSF